VYRGSTKVYSQAQDYKIAFRNFVNFISSGNRGGDAYLYSGINTELSKLPSSAVITMTAKNEWSYFTDIPTFDINEDYKMVGNINNFPFISTDANGQPKLEEGKITVYSSPTTNFTLIKKTNTVLFQIVLGSSYPKNSEGVFISGNSAIACYGSNGLSIYYLYKEYRAKYEYFKGMQRYAALNSGQGSTGTNARNSLASLATYLNEDPTQIGSIFSFKVQNTGEEVLVV
jgi:hypothetical protein